jgi:hypothetical protein
MGIVTARAFIAGWSALAAELMSYGALGIEPEKHLPKPGPYYEEWAERQGDLTELISFKNNTFTVTHPWAILALVESFAETLEAGGGENFIELNFIPSPKSESKYPGIPGIVVTIQNKKGQTPGEKIEELERELAELKENLDAADEGPFRR